MADPSPNQSRSGGPPVSGKRGSSGEIGHGPASSRTGGPPSEPRSSRGSIGVIDAQLDRPARLQMIVALVLGLVLIAIPLYLWRRPRAEPIVVNAGAADAGGLPVLHPMSSSVVDDKLLLSAPKNVSCHDPGPKKTPPDRCDHVAELEAAFAKAIEDSAACVPKDAGGGTITFVADVHFKKKSVAITSPKAGRTLKNPKIVGACEKAVKAKLASSMPFASAKHEHMRYRVSITATYPADPR